MAETTKIKEELYYLTSNESDITETDISTGQTGLWLQGWRWQVPVGIELVFLPEHYFGAYMEDDESPEVEFTVSDKVRILIKDQSQLDAKLILGPCIYTQVKEFQDETKLKYLDISQPIIAKENDWIIIEVNAATSMDASDCYWVLTCNRVKHAIF